MTKLEILVNDFAEFVNSNPPDLSPGERQLALDAKVEFDKLTGDKRKLIAKYHKELKEIQRNYDPEPGHVAADEVLCNLLNELGFGKVITEYNKVDKWYA